MEKRQCDRIVNSNVFGHRIGQGKQIQCLIVTMVAEGEIDLMKRKRLRS